MAPLPRVLRTAERRCAALALACLLTFAAAPAQGEDPRARAKGIAAAGIASYEAGDWESAIEKLREADAIFDAPHHDVYIARSLKQLGRWLDARESYRAAIGAPPDRPGFADARALAEEELAQLEAALPSVEVAALGAEITRITVDGRARTPDPGGSMDVDPGKHVVRVQTGDGRTDEKTVELAERGSIRVVFSFGDAEDPAAPAATRGGRSWVAPGIAFGVGGAGLVLGTVTGLLSISSVGDLEEACPSPTSCPASEQDTIDSAGTLANVSNVGFVVAGVGVAVGVVLLLVTGNEDATTAASPHPGGAGWRTTF